MINANEARQTASINGITAMKIGETVEREARRGNYFAIVTIPEINIGIIEELKEAGYHGYYRNSIRNNIKLYILWYPDNFEWERPDDEEEYIFF